MVVVVALVAGGGTNDKPQQTPAVFEGSEVTIAIRDFDYSPRDATISAGTTVTWVNSDSERHDAVEAGDELWRTGLIEEGESGAVTFDDKGEYDYHCSIHPYMEGTLTVID
jgi:plastocyanin